MRMTTNKFHKILFLVAIILVVASWVIALYYWPKLPDIILTHFGLNGQPDDWSHKSVFYVFLLPFMQLIMQIMFIFLYYKPQYSNMPTTMWLMALDAQDKAHAFSLIRVMMVGISLWIGALFTYLTYMMNVSAMNQNSDASPLILWSITGGMVAWMIYWSIRVYKATKVAVVRSKTRK